MSEEKFGIVVTARMRHAALWRTARKLGSNKALAAHLGIQQATLGEWINLRRAPSPLWLDSPAGQTVMARLFLLLPQTPSELWPPPLRAAIKGGQVGQRLERHYDLSMAELAHHAQQRLTLPSPETVAVEGEARALLDGLLDRLPKRLRTIIELRFGLYGDLPCTLEEVGRAMGLTGERVRELQNKALNKLRDAGCFLSEGALETLAALDTAPAPG